jgi:hypothetical protein
MKIEPKWIKIAGIVAIIILVFILLFKYTRREKLEGGVCTDVQDEIDGKCYEKCREGYSSRGTSCYEVCKEGEASEGLTCTDTKTGETRTILSYERAEIKVPEVFKNLSMIECENGFHELGTMCMENCKDGFDTMTFFCAEKCSNVVQDQGMFCASTDKSIVKKSYIPKFVFSKNADLSNVMACADGYTRLKDSSLCIQECPAQHVLDGAMCIEQCGAGETDLGAKCMKGEVIRAKNIMPVGIAEVPIRT